jgi:POT family proton-dependent oligopeptide transporter
MNTNKDKAFFGHPIGLSTLFASEMWERFSYYGMRALLVLFLTATFASGGFEMAELEAFTIYGIFTGLVYVTPIIGGILADKVLGQRKTIYIGGMTMAIGQFLLSASAWLHESGADMDFRQTIFFAGLGILILGNGFFKPNISTMVGELYDNNDPRKDGGFTIFYMGINIGAFFSPLVAGKLGEQVAWQYGFLAAGVGMLIGTTWFLLRSHTLGPIGMPPKVKLERVRLAIKDWFDVLLYVLGITAFIFGIILGWSVIPSGISTAIIYVVGIGGVIYLITSIIKGTSGKTEWSRVGVILVLAVFNIFFWSGFEQAGTTFNVFARDNTMRMIGNWEIPAS